MIAMTPQEKIHALEARLAALEEQNTGSSPSPDQAITALEERLNALTKTSPISVDDRLSAPITVAAPKLTLEEKYDSLGKKYNELQEKLMAMSTQAPKALGESLDVVIHSPTVVEMVREEDETKVESSKAPGPVASDLSPEESATEIGKEKKSEDEPAKESMPPSRARILLNRRDPSTGVRKDYLPTDPEEIASEEASFAFTLRKRSYGEGDDSAEIVFRDNELWDLLKDELGYYHDHTFRGRAGTIDSPYAALIWNWDRLREVANKENLEDNEKLAHADLRLLLETIESGSGDSKLDKYFRTRETSTRENVVTFDTLWIAFPLGTLVYGRPFADKHQVFIAAGEEGWPEQEAKEWWLFCWTYDWKGTEFVRRPLYLSFKRFDGQKPLTSLPYHPFELHKDYKTIKSELIERGKKFRDLCIAKQGSRMFDYKGEAISGKKGFTGIRNQNDKLAQDTSSSMTTSPLNDPSRPEKLSKVESTVMVDYESYFQYGPQDASLGSTVIGDYDLICGCNDCKDSKRLIAEGRFNFDGKDGNEKDWTPEQFMLCPPRVLGYILGTKQWAQLHIGDLRSAERDHHKDTWDNKLQLAGEGSGSHTKNLLMSLVQSHGDPQVQNKLEDIVAEKGNGLVILLYGPPGVGKTTTAETMALAAGKPLFSVTVADVGTQASNVEANLQIIFKLANTWGAILLIDEADVFLESRQKGPGSLTEKNALVSVFLRVLEYYKGILILTTNQISKFDVAVQSRVHVAIKYEQLDKRQTMAIFEQFLNQLESKGLVSNIEVIKEYLNEDVCKLRFDGRQIRNIMTSAVGLVHAKEKTQLTKNDIKEVVSIVKDFKDEYAIQFDRVLEEERSNRRL